MKLRILPLHACCALWMCSALAQSYPTKPIRIVIPYPPGGGTDIVVRAFTPRLTEKFGQSVVVDHRGGATGIIGSELVARAAPDGYTLLAHTNAGLVVAPQLIKNPPYDPVKDFAPVTLATSSPYVLVVNPKLPVTTVAQLIALAKARPGELNFASSGNGSSTHLAGLLLNKMAGVRMVHVPYKGSAPAVTDVIAGHVQTRFSSIPPALPHVRGGRLRALAVTGAKRFSLLSDLPTIGETVPGYVVDAWYGVLAPAGTPVAIVNKLNAEIVAALQIDEIKARLANDGAETVGSTPQQFGVAIRNEIAQWSGILREAGAGAQ
ncbi:MAG TPA: tripartite tricarboxylate transporter substrate binding protein [Burkholderiales bacterium]|nr:tripartite tricarboxylate transporter substrate binding protein [Burkholderiales bacterium]